MFVFEMRLVNAKGLITAEKDKDGKPRTIDPFIRCAKCGAKSVLEFGITTVLINEFQLANMLRVLESRNRELYRRINEFYEKVTDAVEII